MKTTDCVEAEDGGVLAGNIYDKYGSRNPLVRWVMRRFDATLSELIARAEPMTVHEVGCGEGFWVLRWNERGIPARGSDSSARIIEIARAGAAARMLSPLIFQVRDIYQMEAGRDNADCVVCSEVLEHLERPEQGLQALRRVVDRHLIVSVPWEPVWRLLNIAQGRYIGRLGNTPGHIQHWTRRGIVRLVAKYFEVLEVRHCVLWTMLLCRRLG